MSAWGTAVEQERRNRIKIAVAAYAYECHDDSIMSDDAYDRLAQGINRGVETGHAVLDRFFRDDYSAMTGMWIRDHPEIAGVEKIYRAYYRGK